jgi:intracellular sulfur oxidation DsrE/DsrF family protein
MTIRRLFILCLLLLTPLFTAQAVSAPINDAAALRGVKEGKGVFLIDFSDPRKTAFYLEIIKGTHAGLARQNVKPDFVIVYIGPTVRFLSTAPDGELELEHGDTLKAIAERVKELERLGVRQEICAIATKAFKAPDEAVLPGLTLIGDGFISLIGWQSQGYKLIPLF